MSTKPQAGRHQSDTIASPGVSVNTLGCSATDGPQPSTRFVLRCMFRIVKPYLPLLGCALALSMATRGLVLTIPHLASRIVDSSTGQIEATYLHRDSLCLGGVFLATVIIQLAGMVLFAFVGQKVVFAIRKDVFSHLLSMSVEFFERRRVGELMSRVAADATVVQEVGTNLPVNISRHCVTVVGGVLFVMALSMRLTLILIAFLPLVGLTTLVFGRIIRRLATQEHDHLATANGVYEETLSSIRTVKSFVREEHEVERYGAWLGDVFSSAMWVAVAVASLQSIVTLILYGGMATVLWTATAMIQAGELTSGKLIAFMLYAMMVGNSFSSLSRSWASWQRLLGAGKRVFQIFLETPTVVDRPGVRHFDGRHQTIEFDHVCFAYPSEPQRQVLTDLSFTVKRGQIVALVGESGAGKSTIAALLLQLYDTTSGSILIDRQDMRDLKQADVRSAIAVVPQDIVVFGRTLRENIAYGKLDATDNEIVAAARTAHALEFIERTPDGLDTLVGERGVTLSGGERQRIAIARAILKDPAILILDEATSALDRQSEALVKDALSHLMNGRTTFVIAHRLSTIERADCVLVLQSGKLIESGTHAELFRRNGHYATSLLHR